MGHVRNGLKFHTCRVRKNFRIWTNLLNRFKFKVGPSTRVCSNHFKHGRPSLDEPHPTLYLDGYPGISCLTQKKTPVERKKVERVYKSPVKRRKYKRVFPQNDVSNPAKRKKLHFASDISEDSQTTQQSCKCNTNSSKSEEITPFPSTDHNYEVSNQTSSARCQQFTNICQKCRDRVDDLRQKLAKLSSQLQQANDKILGLEKEVSQHKNKSFELNDIEHDDNFVELYTGMQNSSMFYFLLSKLYPKTTKLQYYRGANSHDVKGYQMKENWEKPGRKRTTTPEQELFLTLCRLRQGLSVEDLSYRFRMSVGNVSTILSTWIPFLARELEGLCRWPTREQVLKFYPDCFKPYPNVCSIIDCTEIYLQRPSLAEAQVLTYSNYKSHNTTKFLVSNIFIV